MKILVCVSVVPDTTTKITFNDNDTTFTKTGVQFIINPYDELALTRAIEIDEQNSGSVDVITVGEPDCDPIIRKALAMGANEAFRVNAEPVNSIFVAQQIANHAKNNLNAIFDFSYLPLKSNFAQSIIFVCILTFCYQLR